MRYPDCQCDQHRYSPVAQRLRPMCVTRMMYLRDCHLLPIDKSSLGVMRLESCHYG